VKIILIRDVAICNNERGKTNKKYEKRKNNIFSMKQYAFQTALTKVRTIDFFEDTHRNSQYFKQNISKYSGTPNLDNPVL